MILDHIGGATNPQIPAAVATALAIPRECVKKSMQRIPDMVRAHDLVPPVYIFAVPAAPSVL
jgi:hypothetical protein